MTKGGTMILRQKRSRDEPLPVLIELVINALSDMFELRFIVL